MSAQFFVSCPIGFEAELIREIESFWFQFIDLDGLPTRTHSPEFKIEKGGVELKTELHLGLQINLFSKLALRVLMRVYVFEARYFDQFEKKLTQLSLNKYIDGDLYNIQIESSKSRLFHEGNLLEAAVKVFAVQKMKLSKESNQTLFIRLFQDKVTVSLDTSGRHLHFRGYRKNQGEAPLRENLASLVLRLAELESKKPMTLLDPYCGSGTFFFEHQLFNIPNLVREFSFLQLKNTPALFKSPSWTKNFRWLVPFNQTKYVGYELNHETCLKLKENQTLFKTQYFNIDIDLINGNSETVNWSEFNLNQEPIVVVTNPPYGERSRAGDVVKNIEHLENCLFVEKIIIIHPKVWSFSFKAMKIFKQIPLSNQGLETVVSVFVRTKDNPKK